MWILPPFAFATLDSLIELFNERSAGIVYDLAKHSRHKLREMIGRKELPCGLIAEIAAHEDFAEVVVEFPCVVHDGGEQGIHLCEDLRKFPLLVGLVVSDNVQISLFPFIFLCKVNCVGYGDCLAFEQVGHEFGSVYRISGFFDILYDLFDFRDRVRAEVILLG